jgi:hypothetical protein
MKLDQSAPNARLSIGSIEPSPIDGLTSQWGHPYDMALILSRFLSVTLLPEVVPWSVDAP